MFNSNKKLRKQAGTKLKNIQNNNKTFTFSEFCKEKSDELIMSVHKLNRYFGMEVVLENTPLNRAFRNLCTASQHAMLTP